MKDRTIKALLGAVVALLVILCARPSVLSHSTHAQGPAPAEQPALAASNGLVYTLQGNQLSVYYLDLGLANPLEALRMLTDEKTMAKVQKTAKVRLLFRQNMNEMPAEIKKAG
jgi:hypothetical protein